MDSWGGIGRHRQRLCRVTTPLYDQVGGFLKAAERLRSISSMSATLKRSRRFLPLSESAVDCISSILVIGSNQSP